MNTILENIRAYEPMVAEIKVYFGVDFVTRNRQHKYRIPRQIAQTVLKETTPLSLAEIGALTGGFDHATILNSVKRVGELSETEADVWMDVETLKMKFK